MVRVESNERCRCSQDASLRSENILRGSGARATLANMVRQLLEPFERIWPIKRGLRAALSSGLTQFTSFLSPRPLSLSFTRSLSLLISIYSISISLVLSLVLAATLPLLRVIPGCIIHPTPLLPPTSTGCFSPAPSTTVPIDEFATTGL